MVLIITRNTYLLAVEFNYRVKCTFNVRLTDVFAQIYIYIYMYIFLLI